MPLYVCRWPRTTVEHVSLVSAANESAARSLLDFIDDPSEVTLTPVRSRGLVITFYKSPREPERGWILSQPNSTDLEPILAELTDPPPPGA